MTPSPSDARAARDDLLVAGFTALDDMSFSFRANSSAASSPSLAAQAEDAVRSGYSIIIISDRRVDRDHLAIPALLALSAVHQHLVGKGLRTKVNANIGTSSDYCDVEAELAGPRDAQSGRDGQPGGLVVARDHYGANSSTLT